MVKVKTSEMYRTTWSLKASKPICRNTKIQVATLLWTQGGLLLRWNLKHLFLSLQWLKTCVVPKCETEQLVPCFHFLSRNLLEQREKITLTRTSLCRCYYWIKFSSLSNSNHVERRSVECHLIVQERFTAVRLLRWSLHFTSAEDSFVKQSFWPPWVKQDNVTNTCGLLNVWWMFVMLQPDNCSNKSTERVLISASSAHFLKFILITENVTMWTKWKINLSN